MNDFDFQSYILENEKNYIRIFNLCQDYSSQSVASLIWKNSHPFLKWPWLISFFSSTAILAWMLRPLENPGFNVGIFILLFSISCALFYAWMQQAEKTLKRVIYKKYEISYSDYQEERKEYRNTFEEYTELHRILRCTLILRNLTNDKRFAKVPCSDLIEIIKITRYQATIRSLGLEKELNAPDKISGNWINLIILTIGTGIIVSQAPTWTLQTIVNTLIIMAVIWLAQDFGLLIYRSLPFSQSYKYRNLIDFVVILRLLEKKLVDKCR
jgi:hypothetical protein